VKIPLRKLIRWVDIGSFFAALGAIVLIVLALIGGSSFRLTVGVVVLVLATTTGLGAAAWGFWIDRRDRR